MAKQMAAKLAFDIQNMLGLKDVGLGCSVPGEVRKSKREAKGLLSGP